MAQWSPLRERDHTTGTGRTGKGRHFDVTTVQIPFTFVTDYLQFVKCLLVLGTAGVRWIKNSEPGVQSTVVRAGVHLKHRHGYSKWLTLNLIRKTQIKVEILQPLHQIFSVPQLPAPGGCLERAGLCVGTCQTIFVDGHQSEE